MCVEGVKCGVWGEIVWIFVRVGGDGRNGRRVRLVVLTKRGDDVYKVVE